MYQTYYVIQSDMNAAQAQQTQGQADPAKSQVPAFGYPGSKPKAEYHPFVIAAVVLVLLIAIYLYPSANPSALQKTPTVIPTTVSVPVLNISSLTNRSNALYGLPDQNAFVLYYNFSPSPPPYHNNYTSLGMVAFYSKSYGMNFTDSIVNYSSPLSPYTYNVLIPVSYGSANYPLAVVITLSKSNTPIT